MSSILILNQIKTYKNLKSKNKPVYTVKLLAMVDIPPWLQGLDINPRETLSNEDFIKVFTRYCDHQIRENNCLERDLTNDKLKLVIAELRSVRTCTDTHETLITDLALKINTFSMYFETLSQSPSWSS